MSAGYIAVMFPKREEVATVLRALMPPERYATYVSGSQAVAAAAAAAAAATETPIAATDVSITATETSDATGNNMDTAEN